MLQTRGVGIDADAAVSIVDESHRAVGSFGLRQTLELSDVVLKWGDGVRWGILAGK